MKKILIILLALVFSSLTASVAFASTAEHTSSGLMTLEQAAYDGSDCDLSAAEFNDSNIILAGKKGREKRRLREKYSGPKGACVYGPSGMRVCINSTYRNECIENYGGTWHGGQNCP